MQHRLAEVTRPLRRRREQSGIAPTHGLTSSAPFPRQKPSSSSFEVSKAVRREAEQTREPFRVQSAVVRSIQPHASLKRTSRVLIAQIDVISPPSCRTVSSGSFAQQRRHRVNSHPVVISGRSWLCPLNRDRQNKPSSQRMLPAEIGPAKRATALPIFAPRCEVTISSELDSGERCALRFFDTPRRRSNAPRLAAPGRPDGTSCRKISRSAKSPGVGALPKLPMGHYRRATRRSHRRAEAIASSRTAHEMPLAVSGRPEPWTLVGLPIAFQKPGPQPA